MPAPAVSLRSTRGIARYTAVLCALAAVAAVVAFVNGSVWLGLVWVLLCGLSSNMAWYYGRRARRTARQSAPSSPERSAESSTTAGE